MMDPTNAFTFEQRTRMAMAVANHMNGTQAEDVPDESEKKQQSQKNIWLHHYATEKKWKFWQDVTVEWEDKVEHGLDFLLEIGCSFPNDDTVRVLMAILSICSKRIMNPSSFYNDLRLCREKLVGKRKMLGSNAKVTAKNFPKSVKDFMEKYPWIYKSDEPPVPTIIADKVIKDSTRPDRMPARSNAKALSDDKLGHVKHQKSEKAGFLQPVKEPENDPTLTALRYVLHGGAMPASSNSQSAHAPCYGAPPSSSTINPGAPELKKEFQLPPCVKQEFQLPPLPSVTKTEGDNEAEIDKLIIDANQVIARKTHKRPAAAGPKKKSKSAEIDDAFGDDDADDDEESDDDNTLLETSDEDEKVPKKRPAAKSGTKATKNKGV